MATAESMPQVRGSSRAMAMEPVMPGRAPPTIPQATPKKMKPKAMGWRATWAPSAKFSSMVSPSYYSSIWLMMPSGTSTPNTLTKTRYTTTVRTTALMAMPRTLLSPTTVGSPRA